mgnify:CR=1 FL=1
MSNYETTLMSATEKLLQECVDEGNTDFVGKEHIIKHWMIAASKCNTTAKDMDCEIWHKQGRSNTLFNFMKPHVDKPVLSLFYSSKENEALALEGSNEVIFRELTTEQQQLDFLVELCGVKE